MLNPFSTKFPDACRLMCFFHVQSNVKKNLPSRLGNEIRGKMLSDINDLSLSRTASMFHKAGELMLQKWTAMNPRLADFTDTVRKLLRFGELLSKLVEMLNDFSRQSFQSFSFLPTMKLSDETEGWQWAEAKPSHFKFFQDGGTVFYVTAGCCCSCCCSCCL